MLTRQYGAKVVDHIVDSFLIDQSNIQTMAKLLMYPEYNFLAHFQYHGEPEERMLALQSFIGDPQLHRSIFSIQKLLANPKLAHAMFTCKQKSYNFNLVGEVCLRPDSRYFFEDFELQRQFITQAISQIDQLHSTRIFHDHIRFGSQQDVEWLFSVLKPHMTPVLLEIFFNKQGWVCDELGPFTDLLPKNNEARHMRGLTIILAIVGARGLYGAAYQQKIVHKVWSTLCDSDSAVDSSSFKMTEPIAEELYAKTLDIVVRTRNRTHWCILAALLLQMYGNNGISEDLLASRIKNLLSNPQLLSPYYSQQLITKLSHLSPTVSTFDTMPNSHRPVVTLPLPERVQLWRYCGPFEMISKNIEKSGDTTFDKILELGLYFRLIPLNMWIHNAKDDTHLHISELAIQEAEQVLAAGTFTLSGLNGRDAMIILLFSWTFLLMNRQTMNLSRVFVASDVTWQDFYERIACTYGYDIDGILETWRIPFHFTLHEVRSLIDNSYSP